MSALSPLSWRSWVWQPALPLPVPLRSFERVVRREHEALATTLPRRKAWHKGVHQEVGR